MPIFLPSRTRFLLTVFGALAMAPFAQAAAGTAGMAAGPSKPAPDAPPEVLHTVAGTVEVGTLDATPYRIDIPAAWNHQLVVYYHGYSERPFIYHATSPLNEQTLPIFERGFAIVQSAYSSTGWALEQAFPETEQLREYFVRKYVAPGEGKGAKPIRTYVAGGSMGGALVAATLELSPKPYVAGLDLCGAVGPTDVAFQRRFAHRAAFDFYFPGIMPPLVPSPPDFEESAALHAKVEAALKANPTAAGYMRALTGLRNDHDVAHNIVYYTFVIADMQRRSGGNPFDNRNYLYAGTNPLTSASDNTLNDGVRRYAAEPRAREYLLHHYTPSGHLNHPMLALHTTYDPLIPGPTLAIYAHDVATAGFADNLVQQYVHRDGHCTFTADEVGRTFDELIRWVNTGQRPAPGYLPTTPPPGQPFQANHTPARPIGPSQGNAPIPH